MFSRNYAHSFGNAAMDFMWPFQGLGQFEDNLDIICVFTSYTKKEQPEKKFTLVFSSYIMGRGTF